MKRGQQKLGKVKCGKYCVFTVRTIKCKYIYIWVTAGLQQFFSLTKLFQPAVLISQAQKLRPLQQPKRKQKKRKNKNNHGENNKARKSKKCKKKIARIYVVATLWLFTTGNTALLHIY